MRRSLFRLVALLVIAGVLLDLPAQPAATDRRAEPATTDTREILTITQGTTKVTVEVEIAHPPLGRGLEFRTSLPETSGMLLAYDTLGFQNFGMMHILIPLSVAFIDYNVGHQQWEIMEIVDMDVAPDPHHGPFQPFHPAKPFRYALEVNQGFFQRHNLTVGAKVQDTGGLLWGPPVQAADTHKRVTLTITQGPTAVTLVVEVADTLQSIEEGLGLRGSLPETAGMLFVFAKTDFQGFLMQDVLIPLSVAYIDDSGVIVDIQDMDVAPDPHRGPFQDYQAAKPCRFALQVNRGFFRRHNVTVGAKVQDTAGVLLHAPVQAGETNKRGTLTITQGPTTVTVAVEVADTPQSIEEGLGFRASLPESAGMLFVFARRGFRSFWMRNVIIPLSVAFIADISAQLYLHHPVWEIVDIQDMDVALNPHTGPFRIYQTAKPCQYALQVNQGFFLRHNLTVGARVQYTPP